MNTPYSFEHDAYAASLHERFAHLGDGDESGATVKVAGRVMLLRTQGKLAFATMRDSSGEIQLFALSAVTSEFDDFVKLHLGDWVGVEGFLFITKTGELSLHVAKLEFLAKALLPT